LILGAQMGSIASDASVERVLQQFRVPPGRGAHRAGVVIGETAPVETVFADAVPFLAGNFARLAANAQRRIGEKRCHAHADSILCANSLSTSFPRGRRPGRMSHTKAFVSIMRTLGSSLIASRSLTTSP